MTDPKHARHLVAGALQDGVPLLTVVPQPVTIDAVPAGGLAVIAAASVDYAAAYATRCLAPVEVTVWLLAGHPDTDPPALYDRLDSLLPVAADAIESVAASVTAASLELIADYWPAWVLTVEVPA